MAWNRDRNGDHRGLSAAGDADLGAFGAVGRALVASQELLDARMREGLVRFEETGIPPVALAWRQLSMRFGIAGGFLAKRSAQETTRLLIAPGSARRGEVRVVLRSMGPPDA